MTKKLQLQVTYQSGASETAGTIDELIIAGWAGRDRTAIEHHIAELEALGVPRPSAVPTFYRVSARRLTMAPQLQMLGEHSSGEVEVVLFSLGGNTFVGVGSDHTDRELEKYSVAASKQICEKPVGDTVWPYEDVASHWDQLILRSYIVRNGERSLYQEGAVAELLPPETLVELYANGQLADRTAMFCGTVPAIGGIRAAERFEGELFDPVLNRSISLGYDLTTLPVVA